MSISPTWTIEGAGGLPIHGNTHTPEGAPRGVALVIHGWTGNKDRNITPVIAAHIASLGLIVHRFTLSHAGVAKDGDDITNGDAFFNDSLANCVHDIKAVMEEMGAEVGEPGGASGDPARRAGPPLVLVGHSRAGATIIRVAAMAQREGWAVKPSALVSLAGTSVYTRLSDDLRRELDEKGYVEKPCSRGPDEWGGGVVRMGPSWYAHHIEFPGRDLLAEDAGDIACPLLIVHGNADDSVPIDHAHRVCELVAANPGASVELATIEGGDHNFNVSGFGDGVAGVGNPALGAACGAVTGFLGRVTGGDAS